MDKIRMLMDNKHNLRNITVVGHVGHGKSTLTNELVAAAGVIPQEVAGDVRSVTDTRADEVEYGVSIKSTGISLYHEMAEESLGHFKGEREGNSYLINLIDSPGHTDFSAEITAALRITDGALVVVDCIEGVCIQTAQVLRQSLSERIKPVLMLNKIDRCFLELQQTGEEMYRSLFTAIQDANAILAGYKDADLGDCQLFPEEGNVAFSSGLHGWAFTLHRFAAMYAANSGVDAATTARRLWGDHFYDPATRRWTNYRTSSPTCRRGFVQFCYEPIRRLIAACLNDDKEELSVMIAKLGLALSADDEKLSGEALVKRVMQTWLPASATLLEMIVFHLPSPAKAQPYRVATLYDGPLDDPYATAIRNCDANGPLMLYVSKMIPASDKGAFFAFGRVFSGTVATGKEVRIMGPDYVLGENKDLYTKAVQLTTLSMGRKNVPVKDVPCGNTVAMLGLDQFITKSATLTSRRAVGAHPMKAMKFQVSPVLRKSVACKNPADLPKLVKGLKLLSKSDILVTCSVEESGEHVIAGAGHLHLEICLKDLQEMAVCEIVEGPPVVSYRETVLGRSCRTTTMIKSTKKHSRLYMEARPLEDDVVEAIDHNNTTYLSKIVTNMMGWRNDDTDKIWCFGPATTGPNMVVDVSRGVQNVYEVKDSVVAGFQWASKAGALAEENMRGVCFELKGAGLQSGYIHHGNEEQMIATARRAMYTAQLTAMPRLVEPMYVVEVQALDTAAATIYAIVKRRRGHVFDALQRTGTPLVYIKAHLPVAEALFTEELRAETFGIAYPQCVFDHWETVASDPMEEGSQAANLIAEIRQRKGLKSTIAWLSHLDDQL